ncbi:MAG: helix-turn-helix transcriptional regulator [Alteromonadaceae bacterium]|nr:helix-turn-helix transcriptional regulator [Alteromonadaceae bacterium]
MNWDQTNTIERVMTPCEVAAVVKEMRRIRQWSQETLADLARINVRGVQRIESGINVSGDTKRAIAAAFELEDLDFFNKPQLMPDIEKLKAEQKQYEKERTTLKITVIKTGKALTQLAEDCMLDMPDSGCDLSRVTDEAFAKVIDYFRDYRDAHRDYTQSMKFPVYDELQALLDELADLGVALASATQKVTMKFKTGDSMKTKIAYLACYPLDNVPSEISVLKQGEFQL